MQSNRRLPLPRVALRLALSSALALSMTLASLASAGTAVSNITPLAALGSVTGGGTAVRGNLLLANDGNFYVTGSAGGTAGVGGVVRLSPAGTATTLVSFAGYDTQGSAAYSPPTQGADGALYGTTYFGGSRDLGVVYKVGLDGSIATLHSFTNDSQGPYLPYTGLVQLNGGDFYGTTLRGGTSDGGTIFKITPTGTLTVLVSFDGGNGRNPEGQLVVGPDGALYGTTLVGGADDRGTVFKVTPAGVLTTLHSFSRLGAFNDQGSATNTGGANPRAGLTLGADGNFYGTAYQGGANGYGTVFRITPAGALTTLHSFAGAPAQGAFPLSTVTRLADGTLVGTTERGGTLNVGTAWRLSPAGVFQTLYSFSGLSTDGSQIYGSLTELNGALYGISYSDQVYAAGVFYRLDLPGTAGLPVSLSTSQDTIALGATATVSWSAPAAASCTSGGALGDASIAISGTQTVTPANAGIYNYIVTCLDGANVPHSASVSLVVTTPAAQPVDGGGDGGGGGAFSFLGLALLGGALALSLMRKHFSKDAAR